MQAVDSSTYVDALDYVIKYGLSASDSIGMYEQNFADCRKIKASFSVH